MKTIAVIGQRGFPDVQGGVEQHCLNIYPHMSNVQLRVYRRKPYLTRASRAATYPHITFVDLPSTRIKGFEAVFHTLLCVLHIAFHRPDAVHVHNIGPGMFTPLLKLLRLPVVMTYHSANYEHAKWGAVARRLLKLSEWLSLRQADRVIFVNRFQMMKYDERVQRKSVYIPNGISVAGTTTATSFLDSHGIKPQRYVLGVGRLTPEKGFEHLIAAATQTSEVEQVVIAGASDHDDAYARHLQALDTGHKVIFTGFTTGEDLRQLYSHAHTFVLSSVNEGFPLVMLEAMGYGLPLLVSDIPATRLIDLPPSRYFPVGDDSALAALLARDCAQAPHKVNYDLAPYDWSVIARQAQQLIEATCNAKPLG